MYIYIVCFIDWYNHVVSDFTTDIVNGVGNASYVPVVPSDIPLRTFSLLIWLCVCPVVAFVSKSKFCIVHIGYTTIKKQNGTHVGS